MAQPTIYKEYKSFMGHIIVNKSTKTMYLFNKAGNKYMIPTVTEMEELHEAYKGTNVLTRPYSILVYQQEFKNQKRDIPCRQITEQEFNEIISAAEKVN